MAKGKKSIFFCQNCGHEESKWLGQCPMCKEWNTFVEEKVSVTRGSTAAVQQVRDAKDAKVVTLSSITTDDDERMQTGILELDRVLGGGIVPGSLVLWEVIRESVNQHFSCRYVRSYQDKAVRYYIFQGKNR